MKVRLTKKLAEMVDGIDISACVEGDVIELSERRAELLIAEAWAEPVHAHALETRTPVGDPQRSDRFSR